MDPSVPYRILQDRSQTALNIVIGFLGMGISQLTMFSLGTEHMVFLDSFGGQLFLVCLLLFGGLQSQSLQHEVKVSFILGGGFTFNNLQCVSNYCLLGLSNLIYTCYILIGCGQQHCRYSYLEYCCSKSLYGSMVKEFQSLSRFYSSLHSEQEFASFLTTQLLESFSDLMDGWWSTVLSI